jgi:hypothetical protein
MCFPIRLYQIIRVVMSIVLYVLCPGVSSAEIVPPEITLTAPQTGETVFGSRVYLSATSTDDTAVAGVQFKVDGVNVGSEVTYAPYVTLWDAGGVSGSHTVVAVTRDTSNNYATSTVATVTVSGSSVSYITPGAGFVGATAQPENIGSPLSGGYDENAIARWDVVPYQTFDTTINVGVVAFHMNDIEKVSFSVNGGTWTDVTSTTRNPETDVVEYWTTLDASDFADGLIEVRAIAYPVAGVPRVLQGDISSTTQATGNFSMWLYANSGGSYDTSYLYVSPSLGNDTTGDGSQGNPYATLYHALDVIGNGQTIRLLDEGTYVVPSVVGGPRYAFPYNYANWTTVESDPSLNPYNVIITGGDSRWKINRIRLHNVSFDVTNGPVYIDPDWFGWADHVRFFDSATWSHPNSGFMRYAYVAGIYATDSSGSHSQYGFTGYAIVRNSMLDHISNDDYTNSKVVINCSIDTQEVIIPETHNDVNQYWGSATSSPVQNIVVYGERGINLSDTQDIFLDRIDSTFRDMAFINVSIDNVPGRTDPPFSQLAASERHILLRNINLPYQSLIFRSDFSGDEKYVSQYVVIEDSVFTNNLSSAPSGTHVVNSRTAGGVLFGSSTPFDLVVPTIHDISSANITNTSFSVLVSATDNVGLSATPYVYHNVTLGTFSDATSDSSYSYTTLTPNTAYTVEVIVTDSVGNIATSSQVAITTTGSSSGGSSGGGSSSKKKVTTTTAIATTTTTSSDPEIQRLLTLLAQLRAQLATLLAQKQGTTPVSTITRDLELGMEGEDVRTLQKYLNTHGYIIAQTGPGSPNNETTRFGPATHSAVIRYQNAHLTQLGIRNGTGYVGVKTRGVMGI